MGTLSKIIFDYDRLSELSVSEHNEHICSAAMRDFVIHGKPIKNPEKKRVLGLLIKAATIDAFRGLYKTLEAVGDLDEALKGIR